MRTTPLRPRLPERDVHVGKLADRVLHVLGTAALTQEIVGGDTVLAIRPLALPPGVRLVVGSAAAFRIHHPRSFDRVMLAGAEETVPSLLAWADVLRPDGEIRWKGRIAAAAGSWSLLRLHCRRAGLEPVPDGNGTRFRRAAALEDASRSARVLRPAGSAA